MKVRIAVLFGGKSVEHEVSVISGIQAIDNLDKNKYEIIPVYFTKKNEFYIGDSIGKIDAYKDIPSLLNNSHRVIIINDGDKKLLVNYPLKKFGKNKSIEFDVAFPIVHGTNVEDGVLQGYLKTLNVPFVGCDVLASAVGMDKYVMKTVLKDNDISILDCLRFTSVDYKNVNMMIEKVELELQYPVIIKPINLGSSVGISVAKDKEELIKAIDLAYEFSDRILVERAIMKLKEINCSVVGDADQAIASECEEPFHTDKILSYEDKYVGGDKNASKGMLSVQRKIPAEISSDVKIKIQDMAVRAFQCLGCNGVSRIDFMIDMEDDSIYLNEINTIPGSLAFYLWEPLGQSYSELLDKLINLALKRMREEESIIYSFDTNILSNRKTGGNKGVKK